MKNNNTETKPEPAAKQETGGDCPSATCSASDWRVEYREKHPLPKFTHDHGCWFADMIPIMRTTSMGKSFPMRRETVLDGVPEYVVGAYCGINRLCYGNFMMAHSTRYGGGNSLPNAEARHAEKDAD